MIEAFAEREEGCAMEKLTPLSKKSKKEQRAYHRKQRGTWGSLKPVSRIAPNGKAYVRCRVKARQSNEE